MQTSLLKQWLRPFRSQLTLAALLAAASVPLLILQCWIMARIATALLAQQMPDLSLWTSFALCFVARQALLWGKEWIAIKVSHQCRQQVRQQLWSVIAAIGPARRRFGSDGALSTLITEQVDALDGYISRYQPQLVQVMVAPLAIAMVTAWHSPLAAVLFLLTAPLVPLFMVLVGREASQASQQQLNVLSRMGGRLYDFLQALPLLKRLNATEVAYAHLDAAASHYQKSTMKVLRLAFLSTAVLEFFTSLAIALVALYLGLGLLGELPWLKQQVPVNYQSALFILLLAPEFYQPLRQLGNDYHAKAQAMAASLNLSPLWHAERYAADAMTIDQALPQLEQLTLEGVMVGDPQCPRLSCQQLQLVAGQRYLLQGPSGSGKSTLLQLLAGFIPAQGRFTLNQQPLDAQQLPKLRPQIAYLSQKAELLPGSISDNLRLAKPDASVIEMQTALQQVGLWQELQAQGGLDYPIAEAGQGLSGGQQQRLALARLLLQPKPIWLLDEPVAELDQAAATQIAALLNQLSVGKTLILASHQLGLFDWLDQKIGCEDGLVSQAGSIQQGKPQ